MTEHNPTKEHMEDPYVLQLIEGLSAQQDEIEDLNTRFDVMKTKAGEMQLAAGRYQYLFQNAQTALNMIDDLFEYAYKDIEVEKLRSMIRGYLAVYTLAASKVNK